MSAFTGSLVIEEVEPGRKWRLVGPLRYEAGAKGSGLLIEVPSGFETDGASIPLVLRPVLAVWGTYGRAAAVHDFGYRCLRSGSPHGEMPTRQAVDAEFYAAMLACGTSRPLALLMWASVRVFGGFCLKRS